YVKDPARRYAVNQHPLIPDTGGVLCSWNRDRYFHFFTQGAEGDVDVVFLNGNGKVVEIQALGRNAEKGIMSTVEARRALILHEGWAGRNRLSVGDDVDLQGVKGATVDPMVTLMIDGHSVQVELAVLAGERERGLMHRPRMSTDDGM